MADFNVQIADLNTRITLQVPTISKDAGSAQTTTYANVGTNPTIWSNWVYDHGQELVQGGAKQSVLRATVTIRYRSDVLSTWRVVLGSDNWNIISAPEPVQNRNRWLVFRVERVKGSV
jgi:SPP1 family predicted phage head-tail adaptor